MIGIIGFLILNIIGTIIFLLFWNLSAYAVFGMGKITFWQAFLFSTIITWIASLFSQSSKTKVEIECPMREACKRMTEKTTQNQQVVKDPTKNVFHKENKI